VQPLCTCAGRCLARLSGLCDPEKPKTPLKIVACSLDWWGHEVCAPFTQGRGWLSLKAILCGGIEGGALRGKASAPLSPSWGEAAKPAPRAAGTAGPAVWPGSAFPSYSLGWNSILENASLKLLESL